MLTVTDQLIVEPDQKEPETVYLRGLGLHVELCFFPKGHHLNPDEDSILASPDAMPGIFGRGSTREEAALACRDQMLALLRTPAEIFDVMAEGAGRFAELLWHAGAKAHKDTPLNNEAHWHKVEQCTFQTAAKLMRAAQALNTKEG